MSRVNSTIDVVVGPLFDGPECARRQRVAKAACRLHYVVCVAPGALRVYRFGKGGDKRWNGKAPWIHTRTRAFVCAQLREMGWTGDVPALPLTATNPKRIDADEESL